MPSPSSRLEIIQLLRALAVGCVVISHTSHELANMLKDQVVNFDAKFFPGDFGVDLFFVISGFIMVHTSWDSYGKPMAAMDFFVKRLIRIVPLYWLMTSVMIAIVIMLPQRINTATSDWGQWITSYLFIPYARESDGLIRPVLGLGWSLQYEMLFYVVFAAGLFLTRGKGLVLATAGIVILWGIGNLAMGSSDQPSTAARFVSHSIILEFAVGVVIGYLFKSGFRIPRWLGLALALTSLFALMIVPGFNENIDRWRFVHYGIPATLMLAAAILTIGNEDERISRLSFEIGESSYSIYLLHPFIIGAVSLIFARFGLVNHLNPMQLIFNFAILVVVLSVVGGYLLHYYWDLPSTGFLRRKWKAWFTYKDK